MEVSGQPTPRGDVAAILNAICDGDWAFAKAWLRVRLAGREA